MPTSSSTGQEQAGFAEQESLSTTQEVRERLAADEGAGARAALCNNVQGTFHWNVAPGPLRSKVLPPGSLGAGCSAADRKFSR